LHTWAAPNQPRQPPQPPGHYFPDEAHHAPQDLESRPQALGAAWLVLYGVEQLIPEAHSWLLMRRHGRWSGFMPRSARCGHDLAPALNVITGGAQYATPATAQPPELVGCD
jgi:hypothetical protein